MNARERRAAHRRAGRCRCGRPRDRADRVQCAGCRLSSCEYQARCRAGVKPDPLVRVSEIRRAWLEAPNVAAFAAWLREVSK